MKLITFLVLFGIVFAIGVYWFYMSFIWPTRPVKDPLYGRKPSPIPDDPMPVDPWQEEYFRRRHLDEAQRMFEEDINRIKRDNPGDRYGY